ncbi:acid protease, partial [Aulographum hederae CBS 113979]
RGAALSVGSPPQTLAFLPQLNLNNTWIFDSHGFCYDGSTEAYCHSYRGGQFEEDESSTLRIAKNQTAAGATPGDGTTLKNQSWAIDSIQLNSNTSINNFGFGVAGMDWGGNIHSQNTIGLAQNSSLLWAMRSTGKIGSLTWSWFWGLAGYGEGARMDGSLVLGGYDGAKAKGRNYTNHINRFGKCPTGMIVTMSQIILNFPNGTTTDMLRQNSVSACLLPDFPLLMLIGYENGPYQHFEDDTQTHWLNVPGQEAAPLRSFGVDFWGMLYSPDNVYEGDMTIILDSGLAFRIPNDQFIVPEMKIDDNGTVYYNTSVRNVLIGANLPPNDQDLPVLGRNFFSSAYLMVNSEEETFTLWAANATEEMDLVPITNQKAVQTCGFTSSATPIRTATSTSRSTSTAESTATSIPEVRSISAGTIAGAVIGCIAVLVAICV